MDYIALAKGTASLRFFAYATTYQSNYWKYIVIKAYVATTYRAKWGKVFATGGLKDRRSVSPPAPSTE